MARRTWVVAAAAVLLVAAVTGSVVALSDAGPSSSSTAQDAPASTARVQRGRLSAMVSQDGTLGYRARPDGTPYVVVNGASGVFTRLPESGDRVGCGGVLYRVDDRPVVLLCGTMPAYRALRAGDAGRDVRQLNANLHRLGCDAVAHVRVDPGSGTFTDRTARALRVLQRRKGVRATGTLAVGDAVFLAEPVRIAKVTAALGGSARPGAPVLRATSAKLHVLVNLDPSQQGEVRRGDRARITLPGNTPVSGRVEGFGRVAEAPDGPDGRAAGATIPTYVGLDDPAKARGLDQAPVQVDITTKGVDDVLSVPVTALVGKAGGGFAVEVVRADAGRALVAVRLGLFDTGGGRVQVDGALRAGDAVVVPSL
jgi:Putative peptidoglycan binding domain